METPRLRIFAAVGTIATLLTAGCHTSTVVLHPPGPNRPEPAACAPGKGPPNHAPAHGLRRRCAYNYYPGIQVYYSVESDVYFWRVEGEWTWGEELPSSITIAGHDYVRVKLETNRPYEKHEEVQRRVGEHPGKGNKKGQGPSKHAQNE